MLSSQSITPIWLNNLPKSSFWFASKHAIFNILSQHMSHLAVQFFVSIFLTSQLMNARTDSLFQACFRKSDLLNLSDLFSLWFRHRHTFHFYALTHHLFFSLYASPPHSLSVSQSRFTLFLSLTRSFSLFHFYESFCVSSFIQGHSFKNVVVQEDLKKISQKDPAMISL